MEEDAENIGLFSLDPSLEAYGDHFKYRIRRFTDQKKLIEKHEGNLEEFAQGNMMKSRLHNVSVPELLKLSVSLMCYPGIFILLFCCHWLSTMTTDILYSSMQLYEIKVFH